MCLFNCFIILLTFISVIVLILLFIWSFLFFGPWIEWIFFVYYSVVYPLLFCICCCPLICKALCAAFAIWKVLYKWSLSVLKGQQYHLPTPSHLVLKATLYKKMKQWVWMIWTTLNHPSLQHLCTREWTGLLIWQYEPALSVCQAPTHVSCCKGCYMYDITHVLFTWVCLCFERINNRPSPWCVELAGFRQRVMMYKAMSQRDTQVD